MFRKETFGGNGRTCETCHSRRTGTLSPSEVQERLRDDPNDPLFLHDGLDDGVYGTSRITEHATIRVERPLPPNIRIAEEPWATSVVLLRGIPGTLNTPALDPALMYDLRALTLEAQALDAIHDHAQNTVEPAQEELERIAEFQRTNSRFFSSDELEDFANGGPPPVLPPGKTASQKRGRLMFVDAPFQPGSTQGICALCHSGPMLNQIGPIGASVVGGRPGSRHREHRRQRAEPPEPARAVLFSIDNGFGDVRSVATPDPGLVLTNPRPAELPPVSVRHPAFFVNFFKIPSLWGVRETAPYFHDNHAKTLEELAAFYTNMFAESFDSPSDSPGPEGHGGLLEAAQIALPALRLAQSRRPAQDRRQRRAVSGGTTSRGLAPSLEMANRHANSDAGGLPGKWRIG